MFTSNGLFLNALEELFTKLVLLSEDKKCPKFQVKFVWLIKP
jgi:hypothetical protein